MAEVEDKVIEFRHIWDFRSHLVWNRQYWFGRVSSTDTDDQLMRHFYARIVEIDGFYDLYTACQTVTLFLKREKLSIRYPHQSHWLMTERTIFQRAGQILSGAQTWNATCRVNLFSDSSLKNPHWWQISPVPTFGAIAGVTRSQYEERIDRLLNYCRDGFTTVQGDQWRLAIRHRSGTYFPITNFSVRLLQGLQKTRRRRW